MKRQCNADKLKTEAIVDSKLCPRVSLYCMLQAINQW